MASETPNLFLSALSPTNCESLTAAAKVVELPIKATLYEPDFTPSYAYFLTSGLASIVTPMANGDSGEVGFVGYEGIVGSLHLLGSARIPSRSVMQLAGKGLRIAFADLQRAFENSEEIRRRILQFVQCEAAMTGQIAGCNRLHHAEQRLARWLLMAWDRTHENDLNFTQEYLSEMIGTERTTVTAIAGAMQREGLIEYSRGQVRILDRKNLEAAACDCYPILKHLFCSLYDR
jgi:CRP-like cAMP-binding protein